MAKKQKVSSESGKIRIQVEEPNPTGSPIVVSFPSGLPESLQKDSSGSHAPKFAWQKLREKSSFGRKIVGKDKHCYYSATSQGMLYDDRRTKLCIGVYDKKKGVLVLREAASRGTVYSLEQSVPSYTENNKIVKTRTADDMLNYNPAVYEDFGSAKKRKVLKSQAANQVDVDHVVGAGEGSAVMQQVLKGESMSESNRKALEETKQGKIDLNRAQEEAQEENRRKLLPTFDEHAAKPDKVYSAKTIAGDEAWSKIYNKVHACLHKPDPTSAILESMQERDWNACVRKLVDEIDADSSNAGYRYTCSLLANYVMKFYKTHNKKRSIDPPIDTNFLHYGIPNEIASRFIELFTTEIPGRGKPTYAMTIENKNKCKVHALLLYMMSYGTAMKIPNLLLIADDMKVPIGECGELLRLAGCKTTKKGSIISASLETPLTFPSLKRGGRGR